MIIAPKFVSHAIHNRKRKPSLTPVVEQQLPREPREIKTRETKTYLKAELVFFLKEADIDWWEEP